MRIPHVMPGMILLLFLTIPACGSQKTEQEPMAAVEAGGTKTVSVSLDGRQHEPAPKTQEPEAPAAMATRVRLTAKGCVEFEPHWSSLQAGQSLSWRSELQTRVVIHVSPGAFDKVEYTVGPGATVSTGPALASGTYSIWTDPAACQGVPRGVQSSGPGVTVSVGASR